MFIDENTTYGELYDHVVALDRALVAEIAQLDKWAADSVSGGWSTHQVDAMRRRADDLRRLIGVVRPKPRLGVPQ